MECSHPLSFATGYSQKQSEGLAKKLDELHQGILMSAELGHGRASFEPAEGTPTQTRRSTWEIAKDISTAEEQRRQLGTLLAFLTEQSQWLRLWQVDSTQKVEIEVASKGFENVLSICSSSVAHLRSSKSLILLLESLQHHVGTKLQSRCLLLTRCT